MSPHGLAEYFYRRKSAKIEGGIIPNLELQNPLCNLQKTSQTILISRIINGFWQIRYRWTQASEENKVLD